MPSPAVSSSPTKFDRLRPQPICREHAGRRRVAGDLRSRALVVDQTSGDPTATRAMATELAQHGIDLIDAPVSGGTKGAQAGTISIMVGASDDQCARASEVLSAISPNIFHAGDVGAGHAMKLVNNVISGAQRLLTLEGLALAAKNGVAPAEAIEILKSGGAQVRLEQCGQPSGVTARTALCARRNPHRRLGQTEPATQSAPPARPDRAGTPAAWHSPPGPGSSHFGVFGERTFRTWAHAACVRTAACRSTILALHDVTT
ncbi:NAD(P)-dependent oxidoreductase [Gordonia mangrovi]|uniref:NAD(P)-dependent oxidoreductase n=1 Tax=Gordonia mangrovi TaxID=2665643 RepID=UPI001927D058|nr:NAD(P)-binding domain-containing protein [Gordonia mangrovi]UVF76659.1 NAD(P)-binding domain-containing protein [Gordonia mangrovi]